MSPQEKQQAQGGKPGAPTALRPTLVLLLVAGLALAALMMGKPWSQKSAEPSVVAPAAPVAPGPPPAEASVPARSEATPVPARLTSQVASATLPGAGASPAAAVAVRPEPSPASRQWIATLTQFGTSDLTPEGAAQWKEALGQLIQGGAGSVPAIREFLESNKDVRFNTAGAQMLGCASAREALISALGQIGGPEAVAVLSQTLQTAAGPRDVALLAVTLEQLEPGVHRMEALAAARQTLAMASAGGLPGVDVGPLFEMMTRLGGLEVVADLQQSVGRWGYYAATALAQLPDQAGVPYLTAMALDERQPSSVRLKAFEGLAQAAQQSPEARATLVAQLRSGGIAANWWPYLAPFLGGGQYQVADSVTTPPPPTNSDVRSIRINSTQENLYIVPGSWNQEQIAAQNAFLDQLQAAAANNQAALAAIQQARADLARRLTLAPNAPAAPQQ